MKKLVSTLNLDKKEWLKYRKGGIGGSDAGAICGLNPYRTAMQVYNDKRTDEIVEFDNEAMREGRDLEEYVARRFMEVTGKKVRRANTMFCDEENPFMLKSEMEEGVFFTRFNFNNNHVKEDVYVINNDIKSIYYQLGEELFVGTYSEKDRKYINKLLLTKYKDFLTVSESYFFEENVLYDFVESGSDDFEDFLD